MFGVARIPDVEDVITIDPPLVSMAFITYLSPSRRGH